MEEDPDTAQMKLEHLKQHESMLGEQMQRETQQAMAIGQNAAAADAAAAGTEAVVTQSAAHAAAAEARKIVGDDLGLSDDRTGEGGGSNPQQLIKNLINANRGQ